jgi:hypothetical protein
MSWVAAENLRSVDRVLYDPTAGALTQIKQLGFENARQLLRYHVGELNRHYFYYWEVAQLVIGLFLFGVLLFGTDIGKYALAVPLMMLSLVALAHWAITPQVSSLGRSLDTLPTVARMQEETRFRAMHQVYGGIEIAKLLLALVLSGFLLATKRGTRRKVRKHEPDPSGKREIYGPTQ